MTPEQLEAIRHAHECEVKTSIERGGWVSGSHADRGKLLDEVGRLTAENERLRAVIQRFQDCSYREEHAAKVALFEALEQKP